MKALVSVIVSGRRPYLGFLVSGGTATLVHWATMALLMSGGLSAAMATAIGSLTGAAANYGLQRRLAFRNAGPHTRTLPRYVLSCATGWLANLVVFRVLFEVAGLPAAPAQVLTTGLVTGLNYLMYERLVFHE
ncbi:GtrA family protein [Marinobacter sp. NFXS9]|uniref:GtrA family protein n=1 Tax=Marinobacter sp. NFXS9 TaxID=2818433 RepID=UPI0032DF9086